MFTLTVHGIEYATVAAARAQRERIARQNAEWGASDGRVTEANALDAAIAAAEARPTYEVVKDTYEVPCEHPACPTMHRHLHNVRYETRQQEWTEDLATGRARLVTVTTGHTKTVVEWIVLRNGVRVGDAHTTKRDALADAATHPTT